MMKKNETLCFNSSACSKKRLWFDRGPPEPAGETKRKKCFPETNWTKISTIASQGYFQIEKMLEKRNELEQVQYLVKWEGYEESTWVNKADFRTGHLITDESQSRILVARCPNLLSSIPLELISHIISFMNRENYNNCRLVSKSWMMAANKVVPDFELTDLLEKVYNHFGTAWFETHLIGMPKNAWREFPLFPFDFHLARQFVETWNSTYCIYPASWEGRELKSIGIVFQDKGHIKDLILTSSKYLKLNDEKLGLAACQRVKNIENSALLHWHQAHGMLSMEHHLSYIPEGNIPLPVELVRSALKAMGRWKLRVYHTWKDIVENNSPNIVGPL
jgi:hypothetical protein